MIAKAWTPVTIAALACAAVLSAGGAAGQPASAPGLPPDLSYALDLGLSSDYLFRGIDQTDRRIAGSAGLEVDDKDLYLGAWASNVDFRRFGDLRTDAEIDLYGGWRPTLKGFDLDIGAVYYGYAGQPGGLDHMEGYLKAGRGFGPLRLGASVYASPSYGGPAHGGDYVEGTAAYRVTPRWTVSAAVGRQAKSDGLSAGAACLAACAPPYRDLRYTTWNLGVGYAVTDRIGLDLRYVDTDAHGLGEPFGAKVVLGVRASFP